MTCVGDLGVLTVNDAPMVINQQLHAFQCFEKTNALFLMYSLSWQKKFMYKWASSTTVPYMNKTICNSIPMINPPIHLQNHFAQQIQNIEQQKEKLKAQMQESENLFQSLLQQAFNGGLN